MGVDESVYRNSWTSGLKGTPAVALRERPPFLPAPMLRRRHRYVDDYRRGIMTDQSDALTAMLRADEFRSLPVVEQVVSTSGLRSRLLVVQAPPGTGKTTAIPPFVAHQVDGRVVVTQPRRIAARAAARRLAHLTTTRPGEYASHTVRGESTTTSSTRVEFVTTGVLLRRLLRDPELNGVGAVILDEVHERHLDGDLVLAMVAELAQLRDDFTVVAMSATLDASRWAELLGGADVLEVPSVLHPLELRWAPSPAPATDARGVSLDFLAHVASVTVQTVEHADGSALVFVPGVREVDEVVGRLQHLDRPVLPLHGRLSPRDQDAALRDDGKPRVVVATAVAESSLTVPGVRIVVDSCLTREPRLDQGRGVTGLVTVRSSQASATQRAGRAARLGPGVAVRCVAAADWAGMDEDSTPEVQHADLTEALLALACWGSPRGEGMTLPSPLPTAAVARAEDELRALGLVDREGRPTDLGRRVATIPIEPRLATALLACAEQVGARAAAEAVALLAAEDRPGDDLVPALRANRRGTSPGASRWRTEADRLQRVGERAGAPVKVEAAINDEQLLALVIATARPQWISRQRTPGEWTTASGTGVEAPRGSLLAGEWLAVWEVQRVGQSTLVRAAAPLDETTALRIGSHLLTDEVTAAVEGGRVKARAVRRLGAITLTSTPVRARAEQAEQALRTAIERDGIGPTLGWPDTADELRRRLWVLHRSLGGPWPDVCEPALISRLDEWLAPELHTLATGGRPDLTTALRRLIPWQQAGQFDALAPDRLEVPTGSRIRLDYPEVGSDAPVVLAVKLQECFGWTETPTIADGHERILLHLLSPARRPLAVTDDLHSFFTGAYASVRAENRGRYAKHPWPEDPLSAQPMRGTTRSGR